ncbi:MAG TPA: glycosyltransferase [Pyrinomonadaceae bacterium]|nr:glycosyltransferase [Pyrinomonadaceae bacterium]
MTVIERFRVSEEEGTSAGQHAAAAPPADAPSLRGVRVVMVIGQLELGGSERQTLALARYLKHQAGADVEVWGCYGGRGRVGEICEGYGIPWRVIPMPWRPWWGRAKKARRLAQFTLALRGARADVLLPYITLTNVFCGLTWKLTGAKVCIWSQREAGIHEPVGPRLKRWATRLTPWFASNSRHGADYLIQNFGLDPSRVCVIHNGVDLPAAERDRASWRAELGVGEDCLLAVMVANLNLLKDHATLIRAWRVVVDRLAGRRAVLLLAGKFDGEETALKVLTFDLGLCESVKLLGPVRDVSGLLGACDLGVFSSHTEGSPNGVLECMAAGLPVAATDLPGVREAVGPEGQRFLAPHGDAEALASRIVELAENPAARAALGRANRQRVETEFTYDRLGQQTSALILRALGRAGGGEMSDAHGR